MLKSQDFVVLAERLAHPQECPAIAVSAQRAHLCVSATHASVVRLDASGLLDRKTRRARPGACAEFLVHGLRYAFPAKRGRQARGLATGAAAAPLAAHFAGPKQVWPWSEGADEGESLEPLHPQVPAACAADPQLREWLALMDALRGDGVRERKAAQAEVEARLLGRAA
jgi:hypothetical protein